MKRPATAEELDAFRTDSLDHPRHQRHQQQPATQEHDVTIRNDGRNQEVAPPSGDSMHENDGHRIFQGRESERAEKYHCRQQHPAHDSTMVQKAGQFCDDGPGLSRDQQLKKPSQRSEQRALVDDCRQCNQYEDQQRYDGQQGVVGNGAREQQRLVRAEGSQDAQSKRSWMRHHVHGPSSRRSHQSTASRKRPDWSIDILPSMKASSPTLNGAALSVFLTLAAQPVSVMPAIANYEKREGP